MTAVLDIEALRAELATRHQALVSTSDPIFLAVALNDLVLSRYVARIEELNAAARTDASVALTRYLELAKGAAAALVTHNAQYIADQVRAQVDEQLSRAASHVQTCTGGAQRAAQVARWAAMASLLVAGTGICALIVTWLRH